MVNLFFCVYRTSSSCLISGIRPFLLHCTDIDQEKVTEGSLDGTNDKTCFLETQQNYLLFCEYI